MHKYTVPFVALAIIALAIASVMYFFGFSTKQALLPEYGSYSCDYGEHTCTFTATASGGNAYGCDVIVGTTLGNGWRWEYTNDEDCNRVGSKVIYHGDTYCGAEDGKIVSNFIPESGTITMTAAGCSGDQTWTGDKASLSAAGNTEIRVKMPCGQQLCDGSHIYTWTFQIVARDKDFATTTPTTTTIEETTTTTIEESTTSTTIPGTTTTTPGETTTTTVPEQTAGDTTNWIILAAIIIICVVFGIFVFVKYIKR